MSFFSARRENLREIIKKKKLDIVLLFSSRYESGLSLWASGAICNSAFHYYFITPNDHGFIEVSFRATDLRNRTSEKVIEFEDENTVADFFQSFLAHFNNIGIAGPAPFNHISYKQKNIIDITPDLEELLCIKSENEIAYIAETATNLIDTLSLVNKAIQPGLSEVDIENIIKKDMYRYAERFSFPITVISGERLKQSTVGKPSLRTLKINDAILIDFGAYQNGFYTDCTRMYFVGESKVQKKYEILKKLHRDIISTLKIGMTLEEIKDAYKQNLVKNYLPASTLEEAYLGHSIGFYLHEQPFIYQKQYKNFSIIEGMVFTLEPEIIVEDYHLRIEDMITIKNGEPIILTP